MLEHTTPLLLKRGDNHEFDNDDSNEWNFCSYQCNHANHRY